MPRDGTGRRYQLTRPINSKDPMDGKTPAQRGILYYMQLREIEKRSGATQAEMIEETGMAERTVGTAVRALVAAGEIA